MAETAGAQQLGEGSLDHEGLSESGWDALLSEGMAGRRQSPGTPPKGKGPLQIPLPHLRRDASRHSSGQPGHGVNVADDAKRAAFLKADHEDAWKSVGWDTHSQTWRVPSRSDAASVYWLGIRAGSRGADPWWQRLWCSCPNETTGRRVCWHKAAVVRRWQHHGLREGEAEE